jgi:hypothetical protein
MATVEKLISELIELPDKVRKGDFVSNTRGHRLTTRRWCNVPTAKCNGGLSPGDWLIQS